VIHIIIGAQHIKMAPILKIFQIDFKKKFWQGSVKHYENLDYYYMLSHKYHAWCHHWCVYRVDK